MPTTIPSFCRDLKTEKWCNDEEIDTLESYLLGSISVTEAAEKLTTCTDRKQPADSKVGRMFTLILSCADECADAHEELVELVRAVVAVVPEKRTGGVDWRAQERGFKELWRDSYDSLSVSCRDKTSDQGASSTPLPVKWTNFHAFSASIASSGIFGNDFAMASGLSVIIAALEKKTPTAWDKETDLPAAMQWLLHASKIIFRHGRAMGVDWDEGSELWHGSKGFSKERWSSWKDRVEQIQSDDGLTDEIKELAMRAVTTMGKAQRAKH